MKGGLTPVILDRMVERFNRKHRVGCWIRVWPDAMGVGDGILVRVAEPGAYVLGGHTAVVQVTGGHGCIDLLHVRRAYPDETQPYTREEVALIAQLAAQGLPDGAIARRLSERNPFRKRSHKGVRGQINALARAAGAERRTQPAPWSPGVTA